MSGAPGDTCGDGAGVAVVYLFVIVSVCQVPLVIPVGMVLVSLYLLIAPIVDDPRIEFLYAALFVLGGLLFYVPLVHVKVQIKYYGTYAPRAAKINTTVGTRQEQRRSILRYVRTKTTNIKSNTTVRMWPPFWEQ